MDVDVIFVWNIQFSSTWQIENRVEGRAAVPLLQVVEQVRMPPDSISRAQLWKCKSESVKVKVLKWKC